MVETLRACYPKTLLLLKVKTTKLYEQEDRLNLDPQNMLDAITLSVTVTKDHVDGKVTPYLSISYTK